MSTDREQLAAALVFDCGLTESAHEARAAVDKLWPVVDRIANERAAAELRKAGKALHVDPLLRSADYASYVKAKLDDLAAALDPS